MQVLRLTGSSLSCCFSGVMFGTLGSDPAFYDGSSFLDPLPCLEIPSDTMILLVPLETVRKCKTLLETYWLCLLANPLCGVVLQELHLM